ncbi:MAG: hypothetical protein A3H96_13060 [Acidobacteria bacterium RIFCSPLOWO2_02_FULL_67_36]|nr:MAG: hypothetical protein A3H96_13060 [Acidobacteria bacterium RIFCSPLOWO2_02_FULL_67_36]OFW23549.1 MAG: hypothetical protein A3G21_06365 [Acidobacteria bacterium RIFCSPLOWO2_12_FULL_66_21]
MDLKRLAASAAVIAATAGSLAIAIRANGQKDGGLTKMRQELAHREHGLRGAASVTGSYVGRIQNDELGSPSSLRSLTASADVVVLARIDSNLCQLTKDGFSIITQYETVVERVFKGSIAAGDRFFLTLPGGRVTFEEGTWAQLNVPDLARPEDGGRYLLFLRDALPIYGAELPVSKRHGYVPAFGGLGIYSLNPRGAFVYPAGNVKSLLGRKVAGERMSVEAFLRQIEVLARD